MIGNFDIDAYDDNRLYNSYAGLEIVNSGTLISEDEAVDASETERSVYLTLLDGSKITGNLIDLTTVEVYGKVDFSGTDSSSGAPSSPSSARMAGWGSSTMEYMGAEVAAEMAELGVAYYNGGDAGVRAEHTLAQLGSHPALITVAHAGTFHMVPAMKAATASAKVAGEVIPSTNTGS